LDSESCFQFVLCISILEGDGVKKGGTEMHTVVVGTRAQRPARRFSKGIAVIIYRASMAGKDKMVHQFNAERQMEDVIGHNMLLSFRASRAGQTIPNIICSPSVKFESGAGQPFSDIICSPSGQV
jgi:hypothetical protein